ncbi:MAG: phosphatase PAP2 family protein [Salinarimonas sp.]
MRTILAAFSLFLLLVAALSLPGLQPFLTTFDRSLPLLLRDPLGAPLGPDWFNAMVRDVSALGSMTVLVGTGLLVIATHWLRDARGRALRVGIVLFGAIALNATLKALIARPRPDLFEPATQVFTNSFPSAHAMVSAALVTIVARDLIAAQDKLATARFIAASAALIVVLIGLSRIHLGVHWPSDVLAGWALGFAWAGIAGEACRRSFPDLR